MHNNKLQQDILTKMARQIKVTANLESIPNWVFSIGVGNTNAEFSWL